MKVLETHYPALDSDSISAIVDKCGIDLSKDLVNANDHGVSDALHEVVDLYGKAQKKRASSVKRAVSSYCAKAREKALAPLEKDVRMPRSINYLERYGALLGIDNRRDVLRGLESTIDLADQIIQDANGVDVSAALVESASRYVDSIMALCAIRVPEAGRDGESQESLKADLVGLSPDELVAASAIHQAFSESLEQVSKSGHFSQELEALQVDGIDFERQLQIAIYAGAEAAESFSRAQALDVAGETCNFERPLDFDDDAVCKAAVDFDAVRDLAAEVRISFNTFSEVVKDNGLFAAFAGENSYGSCNGFHYESWWDDLCFDEYMGKIPGRSTYEDIPTFIEEDEGGDSLETAVSRMREFNKVRYWGLLDDDFQQHVDAFWYGFKKLMLAVNGLFELDLGSFKKYCADVDKAAQSRAYELGLRMDSAQVEGFAGAVKEQREKL